MKEGYNLVVSYAREGEASSNKDWIDHFCRYLQIFVNRLSAYNLTVVRSQEVKEKATNTIFIPVVSQEYLRSTTCKKELQEYHQINCPVFQAQKSPVNRSELPDELKLVLSYKFFEKSVDSEEDHLLYDPSASFNKNYWLKLIDLAYDIVQSISYSEHKKSQQEGKYVYLAETTFDQENSRDIIKRELQRYGYNILPDQPLPEEAAALEKDIRTYLEKCAIAIHVVGSHYGNTVKGTDLSIVGFQNKIANAVTEERFQKDHTLLKRYLWSPPNMRPADEKQMLYLDQLKEEIDKSTNAEIIQVPLEVLKSIVEKELEQHELISGANTDERKNGSGSAIYLVYDKEDASDITSLKSKLEGEKFEVLTPNFEGDQVNLLDLHRSHLVESDAVLIYANRSNEFWLSSKINDLIKSPGFGRSKPFLAKAICAPNHKLDITGTSGYNDLMTLENLNTESINSFLGKIK